MYLLVDRLKAIKNYYKIFFIYLLNSHFTFFILLYALIFVFISIEFDKTFYSNLSFGFINN